MNFACIIKIKGSDSYLGQNLKEVPRKEAPIEKREAAIARARRRFGPAWEEYAEVIEVDYSEWMSFVGRKGGHTVTPKKLNHLRSVHKKRFPLKRMGLKHAGQEYFVVAKSGNDAVEMLRTVGCSIHRKTFDRKAKPYFTRLPHGITADMIKHGVLVKNGKEWRKPV